MPLIKGIKEKTMWAVFSPDGEIQFRTIADTMKQAKGLAIGWHEMGEKTWHDYAVGGFTVNKVLVDIKIF